jgi:hypothetical protein
MPGREDNICQMMRIPAAKGPVGKGKMSFLREFDWNNEYHR